MTVQVERVTKRFGSVTALDDVSLHIPAGGVLTVLGPSGSGKSTLLRILAGLEQPTEGRVSMDDAPLELGDAAMVFQDSPLFPHLTVAENVRFPLSLRRSRVRRRQTSKSPHRRRVGETLDLLGIAHLAGRRPHELSGGERQRAGIARALVRDTRLVLFDEPTAHLDQPLARSLRQDLARVQRELGLTLVMVTHRQEEAMALGDTMAVLRDGQLEQAGPPRELWENPRTEFTAGFLGRTPMSIVTAASGERLGFRPEHARVETVGALVPPSGGPSSAPSQRPERARDGALRLEARVLDCEFLGDTATAAFELSGTGERAACALDPRGPLPESGARVRLTVLPEHLVRFGADGVRVSSP